MSSTPVMKFAGLALVLGLAACHKDKKAATTPEVPDKTPPTEVKQEKPAPEVTNDAPVSDTLAMSGDLVSLCGIKAAPSAANPTFDYDKDDLSVDDRNVLEQLATCMTTGPLKGKGVTLIGRADPRGTEEYNLALGSKRSTAVGAYLTKFGVAAAQLVQSTRGALEATGTDEAGWARDRRVDIQLQP